MEINSGLQLTRYLILLPPMLSPVRNPSAGVVPLASWIPSVVWWDLPYLNCSLKNLCSCRTVSFPESCFQCVTVFLRLPQSQQTPPPSPSLSPQVWHRQRLSALVARWYRIQWRLLYRQRRREIRHQHRSWQWHWWQWRWSLHLTNQASSFELVTWYGLL